MMCCYTKPVWDSRRTGEIMDLAMAMGVAMFGLFGGSTAVFLYKLTR
jgi:hypothetical protein